MMPRWLAVLFLVGAGAGVLAVAWHGYRKGEVRAGTRFLSVYRPNRDDNPLAFHIFLTLYFCAGMALCVWGLLLMLGMAPGLRWH